MMLFVSFFFELHHVYDIMLHVQILYGECLIAINE